MKKLTLITVLMLGAMSSWAQTSREKAEDMLGKLTLDEKISLMMNASPAIPAWAFPHLTGGARRSTAWPALGSQPFCPRP